MASYICHEEADFHNFASCSSDGCATVVRAACLAAIIGAEELLVSVMEGYAGLCAGFGMEVTVISTSPKKEKEAINTLGADHFVVSKDEAQMSVRPLTAAMHKESAMAVLQHAAGLRESAHSADSPPLT